MTELDNLREKINEITFEMLKLLKTRTDLSKEIGNTKQNLGMNIADESRAVSYTHLTLPTKRIV